MAEINKIDINVNTANDEPFGLVFEDADRDGKVDRNELKIIGGNLLTKLSHKSEDDLILSKLKEYGISSFKQIVGKSAKEFKSYLWSMNRVFSTVLSTNSADKLVYNKIFDSAKESSKHLGLGENMPDKMIRERLTQKYEKAIETFNDAFKELMQFSKLLSNDFVEDRWEAIKKIRQSITDIGKVLGKTEDEIIDDIYGKTKENIPAQFLERIKIL